MSETISPAQDLERNTRRLTATRNLYSCAKRWATVQLISVVATPILASIATLIDTELRPWTAFLCITVVCLDRFWFDRRRDNARSNAARIQEVFDCEVLKIPWNKVLIDRQPKLELVRESAMKSNSDLRDSVKDWYSPTFKSLPLNEARIFCQWENCWWNSKLRHSYGKILVSTLIAIGVLVVTSAMISEMICKDFVLTVAIPVLPTLLWGTREFQRHKNASTEIDYLVDFTAALLEKSKRGDIGEKDADNYVRQVQDRLFLFRSNHPLVPDWFYERNRLRLEKLMEGTIEDMMSLRNDNTSLMS